MYFFVVFMCFVSWPLLFFQVDYRKVTHELGACYLSPEYKEVTDLLAEYGLDEQYEVSGDRMPVAAASCPANTYFTSAELLK